LYDCKTNIDEEVKVTIRNTLDMMRFAARGWA